jgi:hypothetical protein
MGRTQPPDQATYEQLEAVLRVIEDAGRAIAAEHGVRVKIEHNRAESGRGGKFPYLTFRGVGLLEEEKPFVCLVCGEPASMIVDVRGEDVPRCDEHEVLTGVPA